MCKRNLVSVIKRDEAFMYPPTTGFCFVTPNEDKELALRSPLQTCTDWLVEAIQGTGLWNPRYHTKPTEKFRLVTWGWKADQIKKFLPFLHKLEKRNKFKRSRVVPLENYPAAHVWVIDRRWYKSTFLISLFSKLLRNGIPNPEIAQMTTAEQFSTKFFTRDRDLKDPILIQSILGGHLLDIVSKDTSVHGVTNEVNVGHATAGVVATLMSFSSQSSADYPTFAGRFAMLQALKEKYKGVKLDEMPSL